MFWCSGIGGNVPLYKTKPRIVTQCYGTYVLYRGPREGGGKDSKKRKREKAMCSKLCAANYCKNRYMIVNKTNTAYAVSGV